MWQAVLYIGRFGRVIYFPPRKWKWVAQIEVQWALTLEVRECWYFVHKINLSVPHNVGTFLRHENGYLEPLN